MEFRLACFLLCSVFLRLSNSQDAQDNGIRSVVGPASFVTDGTRELNLTCGNNISAVFGWFFPGNDPARDCDSRPARRVCNFRPRLDDDMQNVTCVATYRDPSKSFQANYTLNLLYPPESSATFTIEPPQTEPLTQGDTITCTVSGGKPRVTNVTFHCQHPDHADQEDDVSGDGRTVNSSVTVNTSQATEVNMTCTCSAHWDPVPELYDEITNAEFMLEYRAIVTNFTVNGSTSKTVAESQKVMFWCQGAGRPSPTLILRKRGNDPAIRSGSPPEEGLLHPIGSARCEDLGNYTCEANNNFPDPNSETVQLFVRCAPRVADDYFHPANLCNETHVGLTVTLVGYPTPNISVYSLRNDTVPENAFNKSCVRDNTMEHLVHCAVTPSNVSESGCGVYDILIWNKIGNVSLSAVQLHRPGLDAKLLPGAVTGIVVGAIFLLALLLLAVFCAIKGVKKKSGEHNDQQYRARRDSADYENADVPSRMNTQHQPQQQTQQGRQQQLSGVEAQPHDASVCQDMTGTHTYNNGGNTYDVLQRDQQDDARTYTGLVTSSRADSETYLELVNSNEGDYEIL